jgi:hypothetical protein
MVIHVYAVILSQMQSREFLFQLVQCNMLWHTATDSAQQILYLAK